MFSRLMNHAPINHRMRGLWRVLATLSGLYVLIFGIVGVLQTRGMGTFAIHGKRVLGLTTNPGFAILSIVVGAVIVLASLIGRNVDVPINLLLSLVFMLAGMFSLLFLRSSLNYLAYSLTNCLVSYLIGIILYMAGMYGRVSRRAPAGADHPGQPLPDRPGVPEADRSHPPLTTG